MKKNKQPFEKIFTINDVIGIGMYEQWLQLWDEHKPCDTDLMIDILRLLFDPTKHVFIPQDDDQSVLVKETQLDDYDRIHAVLIDPLSSIRREVEELEKQYGQAGKAKISAIYSEALELLEGAHDLAVEALGKEIIKGVVSL